MIEDVLFCFVIAFGIGLKSVFSKKQHKAKSYDFSDMLERSEDAV